MKIFMPPVLARLPARRHRWRLAVSAPRPRTQARLRGTPYYSRARPGARHFSSILLSCRRRVFSAGRQTCFREAEMRCVWTIPFAIVIGVLLGDSHVAGAAPIKAQPLSAGHLSLVEPAQAYRGPRGGAAYRGPRGGAAVRGPRGAAAVRGPRGNVAVRGPNRA